MVRLKPREKLLLVAVLVAGVCTLWIRVQRSGEKAVKNLELRLTQVQQQVDKTQKLLAMTPEKPKDRGLAGSNAVTLSLLDDLTAPRETAGISILSVEGGSAANIVVTAKGEFSQLMRFLSFMEREQSKFKVESVDFKKDEAQVAAANVLDEGVRAGKEIRGIFNLSRRG